MRASDLGIAAAIAVIACACGVSHGPDGGADAGQDTGHDVGVDAGRDAGRDGGRDAGVPDGGWNMLPDVPVGCVLMTASEGLIAAMTWEIEACPDRAGCRRIAPVRDVAPGAVPFRVERGHGIHDGSRGVMALFADTGPWVDEWIVDDRGATIAGYRTLRPTAETPGCYQAFHDVSRTQVAFALIRGVSGSPIVYLYRGPLTAPPTRVVELSAELGDDFTQEIRIDTLRAASWHSSQRVQAIEADGSLSVIAAAGTRGCGEAAIADVIGDTIFVDCVSRDITTVYVQEPGGMLEPLLDTTVRSLGLDSDGTDMAWFVYSLVGIEITAELWASPHAIREADVVGRRAAMIPPHPMAYPEDLRVGFGYAAVLETPDLIGVYRLADGARAELHAPDGEQWNGFVQYIGPEEIAVTSGIYTVPLSDRALMFIRLDSLDFIL